MLNFFNKTMAKSFASLKGAAAAPKGAAASSVLKETDANDTFPISNFANSFTSDFKLGPKIETKTSWVLL